MQALMNPQILFIFTGGIGTILILGVIGYVIYTAMQPRMALKRRIAMVGSIEFGDNEFSERNESRRQKRIQNKVKQLEETKKKKKNSNKLELQILQSGLDITVQQFILASLGLGFAVGLVSWPFSPNIIIPIGAGIGAGLLIPKTVLKFLAGKRQSEFTKHFADAIDVIVRGVRSGLPVTECLKVVGREFPDPVGNEFRLMVEGQSLGLTLERLMEKALLRIPTNDFKFFAIVLQIQKSTGGNLAETLAALTNVLRGRKKLKDKIAALSQEAKSSAAIIGCLPIFVMSVLMLLNPNYIMLLFITDLGNYILAGGMTWGGIGVAVMAKMINFKV